MERLSLINATLETMTSPSYLEIGYGYGKVFNSVNAKDKLCCDPFPEEIQNFKKDKRCIQKTSDDFFKSNTKMFDVIFIDGQHEFEYVRRDFFNSINVLKKNGCIVIHDCNPIDEWRCRPISEYKLGEIWNGDGGYRLLMELYQTSSEYEWYTSFEDEGTCILKRGNRTPVNLNASDWNTFEKNRVSINNLKDMQYIINKIKTGWLK